MKAMTEGQRQVLILLSDEFPALREGIINILQRDNSLSQEAQAAAEARRYNKWRESEVKKRTRGRAVSIWLGPALTAFGVCGFARVAWLLAQGDGGNMFGLLICGFLAWLGSGMCLGNRQPLKLLPSHEEIGRETTRSADTPGTPRETTL